MIATIDPFYPIVDNSQWLELLLPAGIKLVQLRLKDRHGAIPDEQTRIAEIRKARDLCAVHHCQLIVNDFWQIALEEQCTFVHLGQEDLDDADLSAIKRAGIRLGVSTHNSDELDRALSCSPDYVALGPIYPTSLKEMRWPPQGLEKITQWKARINHIPLCVIGGINLDRAEGCFSAGADMVSVVTDILFHEDPKKRCAQWLAQTHNRRLEERGP